MTKDEIKTFRLKHMMTQIVFAELLGVTWQAVRFWELGERKIPKTTIKLIKLFEKYPQLLLEF